VTNGITIGTTKIIAAAPCRNMPSRQRLKKQ
jgi:hypothetical protein